MSSVKLYGNWRSGSTQRVQIALGIRGIDYEYVSVDLAGREQETPEFRAINPWGQVPVLVVDGQVFTQSVAIIEAIDELFDAPGPRLLPARPQERVRAREIALFVASMVQPFQLPGATRRRLVAAFGLEPGSDQADAACGAFVRDHLARSLAELERLVERSAGRFCVGDAPSIADCLVIPQMVSAANAGVDVNVHPTLSALYERCMRIPAFARSHPLAQPDAPGNGGESPRGSTADPVAPPVESRAALRSLIERTMEYKEPDAATTRYLVERVNRPIPGLMTVRDEAFARFGPVATKISALDVCLFLRWLARTLGAVRVVEIGVFTGSSSLALLDGMPDNGRLLGFDVSAEYTAVARAAWRAAEVEDRVELRLTDAATGLKALQGDAEWAGRVDLAYVDGLNTQYLENFEDLLPLLAPRGVIVFDNTLWKGRVANDAVHDAQTDHLRLLNDVLHADPRVRSTVLRIGDGLTLVTRATTP